MKKEFVNKTTTKCFFFFLNLHNINKRQDKTCFFLRVYYREVKSLRFIKIHIIQNIDFSVWGRFDRRFLIRGRCIRKLGPFWTGARFRLGPFWLATLFAHLRSSYLVRSGQSIPNPSDGGRFLFPCSVFFKCANVKDYDPFFLPICSVISENSLVISKNGVKHCSFTIV